MIQVAISCARWLGIRCLEELLRHPVQITGVHVPNPGAPGVWWTDVCEADEVRRLGLPRARPEEFKANITFSVLSSHIFSTTEMSPLGAINLHPAPLPQYRGCNSYAHAIINGDPYYAATLHYMDAGIDTGPIIAQEWMPITEDETGISLYHKAQCAALRLWQRELPRILLAAEFHECIPSRAQNESQAHYYDRASLEDKSLVGLDALAADRKRRALTFPPFPPAEEPTLSPEMLAEIGAYGVG